MMRFFLLIALAASLLPARAAELQIERGAVVVVPLEGAVSDAQYFFLRRILKKAEAAGASALILDMNTPGGSLKTTEEIVQMLMKSSVPAYTYVDTNAGSAGALIALATKKVFMAPVSAIGAAAPVAGSGEEIGATMNAKIVSYFSGYFRSVAELNGYHPQLVDGFMNLDKEVKVGDVVINPKGALLTLSAQEATKEIDGKPLLASGIAKDLSEVAQKAGLAVDAILKIEPSGFEKLALLITTLAPLFLLGGAIGAYMEFKSPGFGIAGIISAFCFLMFFAGHYIAGLTGLEVVAVFALGLLFVIVELIFFPGVLALAFLGTAMMIGAVFFAMVDFYPAQPLTFSFGMVARPMLNLAIAIVGSVLAITLLARFLPDLPVFRRLFLTAHAPAGPSIPEATFQRPDVRAGETAVVYSTLRPVGKILIRDALVDVVSEGEFIEAGETVTVLSVAGDRIVVGRLA